MHNLGVYNDWISMLPVDVQEEVRRRGRRIVFPAGKTVYRLGEQAESTYQIISGEININIYGKGDTEILMTALYPNDCFGLMSMLDGLQRSNTAVAVTDCELFCLSAPDFKELFEQYGEIARRMCALLSRRTRFLMSMVNEVTMLSLRQRIGRLLYRLVPMRGTRVDDSVELHDVTHELIASVLGSSRQSIGREIRALEKNGWITLHYRKITIHNVQEFKETFYTLLSEDGQDADHLLI
ncbi:Crp/Fnr family transcriptional regulator [Aestuariicella sp. G3-2]|uniref:Crp/Fnr family transcriptional regulator n=1 Tax=Pseudomaricurvus albidus TaxID=2842452 RepID=UPI001C0A96D0|nr:Crp/Fnr family transcriptional regulator [Aestuariicella albida]MBU3069164.1 Crp/Fnr family transcriptional regulator [Aestuariicella albida]